MPPPTSTTAPSWQIAIAGVLLLMALGLSWPGASHVKGYVIPGYVVPGLCQQIQVYDVTTNSYWPQTDCTPGFVGAPIFGMGGDVADAGRKHSARFGLVGGLLLLILGWRLRQSRYLVASAAVVAVTTTLTVGLGPVSSGTGVAWLAVVILLSAWVRPTRDKLMAGLRRP